ncbi:MAG: hypothetical protein AMJ69_11880 [Gammaproteobacteria bacterium SG8_47]|nr:MAG: hypothetical protein AMJ69_11880 [Gammaproteobacteria bacterium SG8_47]
MKFAQLSLAERVEVTRSVMFILDGWGLGAADQISVLALPAGTRTRALRRYREDTPLPDTDAVMERVDHIVGIYDALRTSYPHNPQMGTYYMQRPHRRFDDRAPLQAIVEDGLDGLVAVRCHFDCAYDWHLDGLRGSASH